MSGNRRHVSKRLVGIPRQHFNHSFGRVRPSTPPPGPKVTPADVVPLPIDPISQPSMAPGDTDPSKSTGLHLDHSSMHNSRAEAEPPVNTGNYLNQLSKEDDERLQPSESQGLQTGISEEELVVAHNVQYFDYVDEASAQLWYQNLNFDYYVQHIGDPSASSSESPMLLESTTASQKFWTNDRNNYLDSGNDGWPNGNNGTEE
ncbi:hypothetical protein BJ912DRAFT_1056380 [Pholiota molesta]|nr:hypothetical protein BJ912DRAFT_1056380 [Pholiota molesta]